MINVSARAAAQDAIDNILIGKYLLALAYLRLAIELDIEEGADAIRQAGKAAWDESTRMVPFLRPPTLAESHAPQLCSYTTMVGLGAYADDPEATSVSRTCGQPIQWHPGGFGEGDRVPPTGARWLHVDATITDHPALPAGRTIDT